MAIKSENGIKSDNDELVPMQNKEKWLPDESEDDGLDREWWSIDECPAKDGCKARNFKQANTGVQNCPHVFFLSASLM